MNYKVREKLIGDRTFYRRLFGIAVPMMIQMGITNFASMLDNIMVGQVGTEQMTGVAIAECGKCRQHVRVWTGLSAHCNDLFYSFCGCPGIRRNVERDGTDAGADEGWSGVCAGKSDFKLHPDLWQIWGACPGCQRRRHWYGGGETGGDDDYTGLDPSEQP